MDAFTHNVEAYISLGYHPICDAVALGGAKLAWDNLPRVMHDPADIEARGNMMMASMMGAIAFQKGLGRRTRWRIRFRRTSPCTMAPPMR